MSLKGEEGEDLWVRFRMMRREWIDVVCEMRDGECMSVPTRWRCEVVIFEPGGCAKDSMSGFVWPGAI